MRRREDLLMGPKERAIEAIEKEEKQKAIVTVEELNESFRPLHDRWLEWINYLLKYIRLKSGEDAVNEAMEGLVEEIYRPLFKEMKKLNYEELVKAFASLHRQHYNEFEVVEDDEKIVLKIDECNVGGRLMKLGIAEVTGKEQAWSFNLKAVPYYCVHVFYFNKLFQELGLPVETRWGRSYDDRGNKTGERCEYIIYKKNNFG